MTIQTIPTVYNGVEFRSRLEARWATLLTDLHIRWYYEYEGYHTPQGYYVPDFWLPDVYTRNIKGTLVEVKPSTWSNNDHEALAEVANHLGVGGILACGLNPFGTPNAISLDAPGDGQLFQVAPHWDNYMLLGQDGSRYKFDYADSNNWQTWPTDQITNRVALNNALSYRYW